MDSDFSDFIVYVDESGDHSLGKSINKEYPIFVLAFCIFAKNDYKTITVPRMKNIKFNFFGHDIINFHEREIRKNSGNFSFLSNKERKNAFLTEISSIIKDSAFSIIASTIEKNKISDSKKNPYNIAMKLCLEALYDFLIEKNAQEKTLHLIFEKRGKKEDDDLELEFCRIVNQNNAHKKQYPFKLIFATKHTNSAGLQFADMVARPIGLMTQNPEQKNSTYEIIKAKLIKNIIYPDV